MITPAAARIASLTRRERAVLRLLLRGYEAREIGVEHGCSHFTVRNQTKRIFAKLGVPKSSALLPALLGESRLRQLETELGLQSTT